MCRPTRDARGGHAPGHEAYLLPHLIRSQAPAARSRQRNRQDCCATVLLALSSWRRAYTVDPTHPQSAAAASQGRLSGFVPQLVATPQRHSESMTSWRMLFEDLWGRATFHWCVLSSVMVPRSASDRKPGLECISKLWERTGRHECARGRSSVLPRSNAQLTAICGEPLA